VLTPLLLAALLLPAPLLASSISDPALGNFDLAEGTLEVWFTPMVKDLYPKKGTHYINIFSLFSMTVPDEWRMGCSWYRHPPTQLGFKLSIGSRRMSDGLLPIIAGKGTPTDWKPGEAHHLAFTWRNRVMRLYADGNLVGQRTQAYRMTGRLGGVKLLIGHPKYGQFTRVIIHGVRVSSVARSPDALKTSRPKADLATLLLDTFANADCVIDNKTRAQVIAGLDGETGGRVRGAHRHVTKPSPGLALY